MQEDPWPNLMASAPGGPLLHSMEQYYSVKDNVTPNSELETATKMMSTDDPWPDQAKLPMSFKNDPRYTQCHNNTLTNINNYETQMLVDRDNSSTSVNEHFKAPRDSQSVNTGCYVVAGNRLQTTTSTSIPDIARSDLERLKSLQRFATQQARSVEELTKRHRKLDHLQRCLKRYEIERFEAGQAVRRIEDRLKELHERTSDLLSSALTTTIADLQGPSSARSSQIVRKPSKIRSKFRPLHATANQMYVESEQMFASTLETHKQSRSRNANKHTGHSRAKNTNSSEEITEAESESHGVKQETEAPHTNGCACSAKQVSLAQKRIAELEARHNTLVEHLNLQRSRLAAADATVVSLARTLLQFTVKTEADKVIDQAHLSKRPFDASNGLSDTTQLYLPHANIFDSLVSPIQMPQVQLQSGRSSKIDCYTPSMATDYTTAMSATVWNKSSVMPMMNRAHKQRVPQNRRSTDATTKSTNEYIHLSATESALPVCEPEEVLHNPGSSYSLSECNLLPDYFTHFDPSWNNIDRPLIYHPYLINSPPLPPPPPLPPKPIRGERVRIAQPIEEQTTLEDEEVSHFMSPPKESQVQQSIPVENVQRLEICGTQRPPPPPYYVNLFGSETNDSSGVVAAQMVQKPSREPKSSEEIHRSFDSQTTCKLSTSPTKTPDTVIERAKQIKHDFSSQNSFLDTGSPLTMQQASVTNFREYLDAMGHDLQHLTQGKPDLNELSWSRIATPSTSCFNSKVIRWFRSSLPNGGTRIKPRHHSLDDKDSLSINSVWHSVDELRILLTENQCEGFLWIHQFPQNSGRSKMRPWRTLRAGNRNGTDSGVHSGHDSPNATTTTNQRCAPKFRSVRWIRVWFVFNVRDQSVLYQEQGKGDRMKGSFRFSEVQSVEPGLTPLTDVGTFSEDTRPRYQSDTEDSSIAQTRSGKQARSGNRLNKTRTLDWPQEAQHSCSGLRQTADEQNQFVFRVETCVQIYTVKAATTALRNLWMDVFHFAIQSARR